MLSDGIAAIDIVINRHKIDRNVHVLVRVRKHLHILCDIHT